MKILHTSDWHLGRVLHERSLLDDQRHVLGQILDILKREPHDVLLVAGDIYDRSLPPADAVNLLSWFFSSLREFSDIPIIMIPGNHDSPVRLSYCAEIFTASNLYIFGETAKVGEPLIVNMGEEKGAFFPVPFLEQGSFYVEDKPVKDHEGAMREAMTRIAGFDTADLPRICVAHCFVDRGKVSDSERSIVGGSSSVSPELFESFDYTALGHLHRPQAAGERAAYSGSILKYSFSEHKDVKEVRSIELKGKSLKTRSIPLTPLHDMIRLKGSFSMLLDSEKFSFCKNAYIEAELTDSMLISNAMATLRKRFPNILSVRQQSPGTEERGKEDIDISNTKRNIEDDFTTFHRHLYGKEPSGEKLTLFQKMSSGRTDR